MRMDSRKWLIVVFVLLVGLAVALRAPHVAAHAPKRGDSLLYLNNSREYARLIEQHDWLGVLNYDGSYEHPALVKLMYGVGIVARDILAAPVTDSFAARTVVTFFSVLQVVLIGLLNPIAGFLLAVQTTHIAYTTDTMLEGIPAFLSTLAIFAYVRYQKNQRARWFYLSALALGMTAAGKYIYLTAGIALVPFVVWEQRRQPWRIAAFGLVTVGAFFLFDPYLWLAPIPRLVASIQYHLNYSHHVTVTPKARPWWWPLGYAAFDQWFRQGRVVVSLNTIIFVLGWLGLPRLAKANRLYVVWFFVALLFLFVWPTKWPQYALVFLPPLCLSAGLVIQALAQWSRTWVVRRQQSMEKQNV